MHKNFILQYLYNVNETLSQRLVLAYFYFCVYIQLLKFEEKSHKNFYLLIR